MDYTYIAFIIPPFYLIQLLFVMQTILLLKFILRKTPEEAITPLSFLSLSSLLGLILPILTIYSILSVGVFQVLGQGNWQLMVMPLVLCGVLSIPIFLRSFWMYPSKASLIVHSMILIYEILVIFVLSFTQFSYFASLLILAPLLLILCQFIFLKWKPKPLWDYRTKFVQYFSLRFHFICWLLCFVEAALQSFGYSILARWSLEFLLSFS